MKKKKDFSIIITIIVIVVIPIIQLILIQICENLIVDALIFISMIVIIIGYLVFLLLKNSEKEEKMKQLNDSK